MIKTKLFIFTTLALLLSSCEIINPAEDIPAYLTVEPFQYNPGNDGIQSVKITDGWVYVDEEFIGAFSLPHTFPVLKSGEQQIFVDPGIKDNGIAATPDLYPFYKTYITTANLILGETTTIQPSTSYDNDTRFIFTEFFESASHKLRDDLDENANTEVIINSTVVKEGNGSGKIFLDQDNSFVIVGTNLIDEPATIGVFSFLELDYKTDVTILMGFVGFDEFGAVNFTQVDFGVNPSSDWNKIYFNVSEMIGGMATARTKLYQIVFQAQIPTENGEFTMENAEIYLDNIKLISF